MLHKTHNLYEASWYILNGGRLTDVNIRKVAIKAGQFKTRTDWEMVIEDVEDKFVLFWKQGRPVGNIKAFAAVRVKLKHDIQKIKDEKGYNPEVST